MGRVQMAIHTQHAFPPTETALQPQSQGPKQYLQRPQLYDHQPKYVVPDAKITNFCQVSDLAGVQQCYQINPMPTPQHVAVPSGAAFQNNTATGIPMPKPMPLRQTNVTNIGMARWTTGIFDCMDDPTNALITATFPCVTFGQIADVLDNGHTTCATSGIIYALAPCLVSRPYRKKLRERFGLVEAPASDWIVHSMFEPCALCQEYRELNNRGINPALGYHGNINKEQAERNPAPMIVPPKNQMIMS